MRLVQTWLHLIEIYLDSLIDENYVQFSSAEENASDDMSSLFQFESVNESTEDLSGDKKSNS